MKKGILGIAVLATLFLLGAGDLALAGDTGYTTENLEGELGGIFHLFLKATSWTFIVVGTILIIIGLVEAANGKGFRYLYFGIAAVAVAGIAIWIFSSLGGQKPQDYMTPARVNAGAQSK